MHAFAVRPSGIESQRHHKPAYEDHPGELPHCYRQNCDCLDSVDSGIWVCDRFGQSAAQPFTGSHRQRLSTQMVEGSRRLPGLSASFKDSNGDGIGDLNGITSKLDYIQGLGVNVIWLSPHYDSPNADNGYDIRDYRKVMTEFGTMADFDELLEGRQAAPHEADPRPGGQPHQRRAHMVCRAPQVARTIRIAITTSGGRRKDGHEPNNWTSFFSGSAWKFDPATDEYYLHLFAEKQPDLNWDNPKVRQEVYRPDEVLARQGRRRLPHGRDPIYLQARRACPTCRPTT